MAISKTAVYRTPGPLARIAPAVGWLSSYQRGWLRGDVIAGITLAAYLLPAGLGDAALAGLPPQAGLYACLYSGLVFWLFCSSRVTSITVTSAISLLVGSTLGPLAGGDPAHFGGLAALTALLVAALAFAAWLVRAGVVVSFISETVLVGFKTGVALVLASTQLPKLCGFAGGHGDFWERSGHFFGHVRETHQLSLVLGLVALGLLILGKLYLKDRPVALFVVIGAVAVGSLAGLDQKGVKMLGEVPQGLPSLALPAVTLSDLRTMLPLAMACFLLGAVETVAVGRTFAAKHGYKLDGNQELLALAGANLAAGLGRGFPVSGGMSQSLVNDSGGARTPLSGLVAAGVLLIVTLFFSHSLRNLPQPVLAAIVLMAVASLFKLKALKRIWRFSRAEFSVAIVALLGVLSSGILQGVLIGAVLSLALLLRRSSRPHIAVLGRVPGTDLFGDVERNPENERTPGVLVFRVDSALLYFNSDYASERFLQTLGAEVAPVGLAIWSLSTTPAVDLAGAEMLADLQEELQRGGTRFVLAEARGPVRDALHAAGLQEQFGPIRENTAIEPIVREWSTAREDPQAALA